MDKTVVFEEIKKLMVSEFEIDAGSISPEALLHDDLHLDSLDMVDLILSLSENIGEKVDPSLFKNAHEVQDLVDSITPLWKSE